MCAEPAAIQHSGPTYASRLLQGLVLGLGSTWVRQPTRVHGAMLHRGQ